MTPTAFRADIATLLGARDGGGDDVLVRMLATRGGRRIVLIEPMPALPATLALAPVTYAPPRLLDGIKSLSYAANMLASRLAREQGCDEALLVTPHGRVLECPTSSFFIVAGGEVGDGAAVATTCSTRSRAASCSPSRACVRSRSSSTR